MEEKSQKQLIFWAIVVLVIIAIGAFLTYRELFFKNLIWIAIVIIVGFILWRFDFLIQLQEFERAVIFRFGKFSRVSGPGWAFMLPVLENYTLVDTRVHTIATGKQDVITKDGIELKLDAVIYLAVARDKKSVANSVINVKDYKKAAELYVLSAVRDIVGSMELTDVISHVDELNRKLVEGLKKISEEWGIKVESVELKDVDIPETVLEAMHQEKVAVQKKKARKELAEAQKFEIDAVREAASQLEDKALAYYYVKALEKLGESASTKFIFPMELTKIASLVAGKIGGGATAEDVEQQLINKYSGVIKGILGEKKEAPKQKKKAKKKKR